MSYETYFGESFSVPKVSDPIILEENRFKNQVVIGKWLRIDEPRGMIKHESFIAECRALVLQMHKYGFEKEPPRSMNANFLQHVVYFRQCLRLYDEIVKHKCFQIEEIYERCLLDGPAYAKFISKARAQSLQYFEAIEEVEFNEYVQEDYNGYDSTIHEKYLIYWDDSEDTVDWPYSMLELDKNIDLSELALWWRSLINLYQIEPAENDLIPILQNVAGHKSSVNDSSSTKNTLLKNTWGITDRGEWFANRAVVPTNVHKTRDTGVPDIETLMHIKTIHKHVRACSEKLPFSANCDNLTLQKRIGRVRRGKWFIHIDFKKIWTHS